MIAACTVIAMLCLAIGWRGADLGGLWRRMWLKWSVLALIMGALGGFAVYSAEAALFTIPIAFVAAAVVGHASYVLGATMRVMTGRRT
jgi:hypothetical protein